MAIVEKYVGAFSACQTVDWKKDKEEFRTFYLLSIAIFGSSVAHAFQCVGASPCSSPRFPAWESCYAVLPLSRWEA